MAFDGWQPYPGNGSSGGINSGTQPNPRPIPFSYIGIDNGIPELDSTGLVPLYQLPSTLPADVAPPQPSVLGGLFSQTPTTSHFLTAVNTDGTVTLAQPATSDISGFSGGVTALAVSLTGATMTGLLTLSGAPTANLHAATKLYVDTGVASALPLVGGTLTGGITGTTASFSTGLTSPKLNASGAMVISPTSGQTITFGDTVFGIGTAGSITFASGAMSMNIRGQSSAVSLYGGVQGIITYSGTQNPVGTQFGLLVNHSLTGAIASGTVAANRITINSDTVDLPDGIQGLSYFGINGNYGSPNIWVASTAYALNATRAHVGNLYIVTTAGTSASSGGPTGTGTGIADGSVVWSYVQPNGGGSRASLSVGLNIQSQIGSSTDSGRQWQAMLATTSINANQGGSAPSSGSSAGFVYGGGDQMWAFSGATNLSGVVGREIDVGIATGASAASRVGLQVVSFLNVAGTNFDIGIRLARGAASTVGFGTGYALHSGAVQPTGTIIGYVPPFPGAAAGAGLSDIPPIVNRGIDFAAYVCTDTVLRCAGGIRIKDNGEFDFGAGRIRTTSSEVEVDAPGNIVASVTSFASGGSFVVGDQIYDDNGTIITINTVDGGGGPLTWTLTEKGGTPSSTPPSNPVQFYGGTGTSSGTGTATVNLAWTRTSILSLNKSGGDTIVGSQAAISTTATSGFLAIPFVAGAPTGTPANAASGIEIVYDTTNHKLWAYDNGTNTWKGIVLT